MADRPITQNEWRDYEIVGEVAEDAVSINLGLMLLGNGRVWLDAVSFEALGKVGEGNEPARALQGRALDNLVAFTKLLGYVRYFHPSEGVRTANWERFAIDSIPAVEAAKAHLNPGGLPGRVEKSARGRVGDAVAVHGLRGMNASERLVDRALAPGELHHGKKHVALGRMRLLQDTIGDAAKNFGHVRIGMR